MYDTEPALKMCYCKSFIALIKNSIGSYDLNFLLILLKIFILQANYDATIKFIYSSRLIYNLLAKVEFVAS